MKELIKQLAEAYGPPGSEGPVRALIEGLIRDRVDEMRVDAMGNLIALKKGRRGGKRLAIAAHMDEIGVVVTFVDEKGYLRFGRIGGVSELTLVGQRVRFANGAYGVIGWEKWLQDTTSRPKLGELFIDVGSTCAKDVPVGVGDPAVFVRPFVDMGQRLVAKSMDDRIGCAVVVQALLDMGRPAHDVYAVFTVQEEVGTRGATVAAYGIQPEIALAVDVTSMGDTPEARPMAVSLGQGPAIKIMDSGMLAHPAVKEWMVSTAEELGLAYQLEVLEQGSTDARAMQLTREGVPAGCLSIPCRYVHTPSEMVDYADVQGAVKLLVGLATGRKPFTA